MNVPTLLDPSNCTIVLIDFQPQMAFVVKSMDGQALLNNAVGLAKAARAFGVNAQYAKAVLGASANERER